MKGEKTVPTSTNCSPKTTLINLTRMRRGGIHGTFQSRVFHDKLATGKSPEPVDRNVCATWKMETLQGESWRVRCSARSGSAAAVAGESLQAPKARVPDKCETVSH